LCSACGRSDGKCSVKLRLSLLKNSVVTNSRVQPMSGAP
jgi:hypothetical protein